MEKKIRRGDVYYADLPFGIGSEQSGNRPIVILQNNTGNKHSRTVIAAIITSRTENKADIPTHCYIEAQQGFFVSSGKPHGGCGLERDSIVMLEQIRTMDKIRLKEYIGTLDSEIMSKVDKALAISVGLK